VGGFGPSVRGAEQDEAGASAVCLEPLSGSLHFGEGHKTPRPVGGSSSTDAIGMSAFGPKRTFIAALHMSAFGGKADMAPLTRQLPDRNKETKREQRTSNVLKIADKR